MSVSVAVVDDQPIVRAGLVKLIEAEPGLTVAGQAADGIEAVQLARAARPDVILMDVRMPRLDGIEATKRILAEHDRTRVIVLTTFGLDEYVVSALRNGASAFLLKDAEPDHLIAAIHVVATGDAFVAPTATRRLLAAHTTHPPAKTPTPSQPSPRGNARSSTSSHAATRTPKSPTHSSSPKPPSRPTSPTSSPNSVSETAYKPSSSPTNAAPSNHTTADTNNGPGQTQATSGRLARSSSL